MSESRSFLLVDAFADRPFTGNSAGVLVHADGLQDAQMQTIAREVNSAETAFLTGVDAGGPIGIRWFTPSTEVRFCGHATLASAQALLLSGLCKRGDDGLASVTFECLAGRLELHAELGERIAGSKESSHPLWWLRMPPAEFSPANADTHRLAELLGTTSDAFDNSLPIYRTTDDLVVFVTSWQALQELRPAMDKLAEWCTKQRIRGVVTSTTKTLTPLTHAASRFFAPAAGVPEDPVTGSMHGPLAAILIANQRVPVDGGRTEINCLQGVPGGRGGMVRVRAEMNGAKYGIHIGGRCFASIRGEVAVP